MVRECSYFDAHPTPRTRRVAQTPPARDWGLDYRWERGHGAVAAARTRSPTLRFESRHFYSLRGRDGAGVSRAWHSYRALRVGRSPPVAVCAEIERLGPTDQAGYRVVLLILRDSCVGSPRGLAWWNTPPGYAGRLLASRSDSLVEAAVGQLPRAPVLHTRDCLQLPSNQHAEASGGVS